MDPRIDLAIFLAAQAGALIWTLARIATTQKLQSEILERLEQRTERTALEVEHLSAAAQMLTLP